MRAAVLYLEIMPLASDSFDLEHWRSQIEYGIILPRWTTEGFPSTRYLFNYVHRRKQNSLLIWFLIILSMKPPFESLIKFQPFGSSLLCFFKRMYFFDLIIPLRTLDCQTQEGMTIASFYYKIYLIFSSFFILIYSFCLKIIIIKHLIN